MGPSGSGSLMNLLGCLDTPTWNIYSWPDVSKQKMMS
jgi:ABC-type lipoprotein export system ATPase subunit